MAASVALLHDLELAGICCKDFKAPLEKACQDSSVAAVLDWLGRQASGNLLSSKQGVLLQHLGPDADTRGQAYKPSDASSQALITTVQRELESYSLLEACPSEEEIRQDIRHQEGTLLQLQSKLRSLQALSSAAVKHSDASAQPESATKHHQQRTLTRLADNAKRLDSQQAACNTLLHDTEQAVADLQANLGQQASGWLLSLSDLQNLHQQDVKFHAEMDRSVFKSTQHCVVL